MRSALALLLLIDGGGVQLERRYGPRLRRQLGEQRVELRRFRIRDRRQQRLGERGYRWLRDGRRRRHRSVPGG